MKFFNRISIAVLMVMLGITALRAEEATTQDEIGEIKGKVDGMEENVNLLLGDVSKLKKIKISGYLQGQYMHTDNVKGFGSDPYNKDKAIIDQIILRRGRIKVQYSGDVAKFVIQTEYNNKGLSLKDAYMDITDPWSKIFTLRLGVFNRPIFEVEYSSSQRESMERSAVIRTLYPGERDLGAMITIAPEDLFQLDIAAFNNTYLGGYKQLYPNHRDFPLYYIVRLKKEFLLRDADLAFDLGINTRQGQMAANTTNVINPEDNSGTATNSVNVGDGISRSWYGAEAQIYWDFLGGVKILGEYMFGNNADEMSADGSTAIRLREFMGYYAYFIKNIGDEWQAVVKYDFYDPNTKIADDMITSTSDLSQNTLGLGIHNYSLENIRLSLWYDMINRQETTAFATKPINNLFTFRAQLKF